MNLRSRVTSRGAAFALVSAWLALALGLAHLFGSGLFFLTLAAGALIGAIWLFWRSIQGLSQDSPLTLEEALGMAAPSKEEERKQSVLRILKDLDYERAVGKLEEKDFRELSERYRAEARALLSNLEEGLGPARERAERELSERLKALGSVPPPSGEAPPDDEAPPSGEAPPNDEAPQDPERIPSRQTDATAAKDDPPSSTAAKPSDETP